MPTAGRRSPKNCILLLVYHKQEFYEAIQKAICSRRRNVFAGEVRWRLDWKEGKTKTEQREQRKMNEPLKCSQLFSILWQTVTNDGWNKTEMREGKRVVSLQAPNKEVIYYYTRISHKHTLLWLFYIMLVWNVTLCLVLFKISPFIWRWKWKISLSTTKILHYHLCRQRKCTSTNHIWSECLLYILLWTHFSIRGVFSQLFSSMSPTHF